MVSVDLFNKAMVFLSTLDYIKGSYQPDSIKIDYFLKGFPTRVIFKDSYDLDDSIRIAYTVFSTGVTDQGSSEQDNYMDHILVLSTG